jgi:hypothetical protein
MTDCMRRSQIKLLTAMCNFCWEGPVPADALCCSRLHTLLTPAAELPPAPKCSCRPRAPEVATTARATTARAHARTTCSHKTHYVLCC